MKESGNRGLTKLQEPYSHKTPVRTCGI